MKLHIITVGRPKLAYAQSGWQEYLGRLQRHHQVRTTHLADKWQHDSRQVISAIGQGSYVVALVIKGHQMDSQALADFLTKRSLESREICFVVGGPDGLPSAVIDRADYAWSFSELTFPHDLAMVILAESLYRASSINAGQPYHRA